MAQRRILLALYFLALYRVSFEVGVLFRIREYALERDISTIDEYLLWKNIYYGIYFFMTLIIITMILFYLQKTKPNEELMYIYSKIFWINLIKHVGAYLAGHLTLRLIILYLYNFRGKSINNINEFYNDVIHIFGIVDSTITFSVDFSLSSTENQFLYILNGLIYGGTSAIFPILVLIISNLTHSHQTVSRDDGDLYPPEY